MSRRFREIQLRTELQQFSNTELSEVLENRGLFTQGDRNLKIRILAIVLSFEFFFEHLVLCDEFESVF